MTSPNKFQIREFKLDTMVADPSILIIAKRGSGKSFIARDIVHHFRNIPGGAIISPTDRMNSFYKHFFPDLFIHHDLNDNVLKKILVRQSMAIDVSKECKKKCVKMDPSAFIVMDDCLSRKKSWAKDDNVMEILMNAKHHKLTYLLTMQTPLDITPELRSNFDYIFILKEDSSIIKRKLWDNYASVFPTFNVFEIIFDECTKDYRAMVIDNRKPCDNIQDKIFWFKASERTFSFGSEQFQNIHKNFYDPDYMKKNTEKLSYQINTSEIDSQNKNSTVKLVHESNPNEMIFRNDNNIDYLFDYFINEHKFNEHKFNEQMRKRSDEYIQKNKNNQQPKLDSRISIKQLESCDNDNDNNSDSDSDSDSIYNINNSSDWCVKNNNYHSEVKCCENVLYNDKDVDHLFDLYMKNDNDLLTDWYVKNDNINKINDNINKKITNAQKDSLPKNLIQNSGTIKISYKDETYELSTVITDLNNNTLIKTLCDHIENLKKQK